MRSFIVLLIVAAACADRPGYDYNPGQQSESGLAFGSGIGAGGINGGSNNGGFGGIGGIGGAISGDGIHGGFDGSDGSGVGFGNGIRSGSIGSDASYDVPSYNAPTSEYEKEFYSFSAPESEFDDANALQRIASNVKKGLRVVFIKGPENKGLEDAALALAKQAADQKTAIYVLNKQSDIGELANKLNNINKNANARPEVHFVKYRTPEDAANAQRAIQSQYDSLGGSSQSHNGGVAPVINFASQANIRTAAAKSPGNEYLPSSVFRF